MKTKTLFTTVSLILASIILKAEINTAVSIDWLTVDADCIVKGKIISVEVEQNNTNSGDMATIKLVLSEKLKGFFVLEKSIKGNVNDTIIIYTSNYPPSWNPKAYLGKFVLVFLNVIAKNADYLHLLLAKGSYEYSIIDLQSNGSKVINGHFNVLKSEKEILNYVSQIITKTKGIKKGNLACLEVPFDTDAYKTLYSGSACYIWVPNNLYPDGKEKCF